MFQRKIKGFLLDELKNEVEDSIFFCQLFCDIRIIIPLKLRREIQRTTERDFYNVKTRMQKRIIRKNIPNSGYSSIIFVLMLCVFCAIFNIFFIIKRAFK